MPNELKPTAIKSLDAINSSELNSKAVDASVTKNDINRDGARRKPPIGSSTATVMVWTLSGIVLAACTTGKSGGGVEAGASFVSVEDGAVSGAAVYFDADGDGVITDADRSDPLNVDVYGNPRYVTGSDGTVEVEPHLANTPFEADVDGAIDTATATVLAGKFRSLEDGGIATPITDLIARRMEEAGIANTEGVTEQSILDGIFGTTGAAGDAPRVTLEDILNPENYIIELPLDASTASEAEMAAFLTREDIQKIALALSEIKLEQEASSPSLSDIGISDISDIAALVDSVATQIDGDDNSDNQNLTDRVDARLAAARAILAGKPVAAPDGNVQIAEDDALVVGEHDGGAEALFGHLDPGGNTADAPPSAFGGVYLKVTAANAIITLGDAAIDENIDPDEIAPGQDVLDALEISGIFFIAASQLDQLTITPDADYHGVI
ncbi:MAG: hypothetical protein J4F41_05690, partial [Alphaproteobacteria bacterium]|nr:hypothetical protein [Alphaproteobacteria bacterium]